MREKEREREREREREGGGRELLIRPSGYVSGHELAIRVDQA